jgi:hypothetical protein
LNGVTDGTGQPGNVVGVTLQVGPLVCWLVVMGSSGSCCRRVGGRGAMFSGSG